MRNTGSVSEYTARIRRWTKFVMRLLAGSAIVLSASAEDDYRVAMITHSDGGASFAVIELPDGEQALLKEGGERGPLTVISIGLESVEVTIDGEPRTLLSSFGEFDEVEINPEERGEIETLEVELDAFRQEIERLPEESGVFTASVKEAFGLLETTRVVSVNQEPVPNNRAAIKAMKAAFSGFDTLYKVETHDPESGEHREIYITEKIDEAN